MLCTLVSAKTMLLLATVQLCINVCMSKGTKLISHPEFLIDDTAEISLTF